MSEEIRIYVADFAAYNNGKLHGVWINASDDLDDIQEQINKMLAESPEGFAEEYAIHDYEGFSGYSVSEYDGIQPVHEVACFVEDARKAAEENYSGCYKSLADYAEELTEDTSQIPENLAYYIDYERMGRDMELSGDIYTIETAYEEVHVFWSH